MTNDTAAGVVQHDALWFEPTIDGIGRVSHYFQARLSDQFDAVLHIDQTTALEPLEPWASDAVDLPETYPTGV